MLPESVYGMPGDHKYNDTMKQPPGVSTNSEWPATSMIAELPAIPVSHYPQELPNSGVATTT
jgi:hypothetical protein